MVGLRQESKDSTSKIINLELPVKLRLLPSWVDGFVEYTKDLPSPKIFRKWSAIACVAGALERKAWIYVPSFRSNLYPNLYTILVGPPAVGKTVVTSIVQDLWGKLPDHHVAPSSVSRASLMDALRDAERTVIRPQETPSLNKFNSLQIVANELGVFIPAYDGDFMNTLTDIYDGKPYGEKKRGNDLSYKMMAPQLNMIAATTPSYLNGVMPEGAWDQGFISRVHMIYNGETQIKDVFEGADENEQEYSMLISDLKQIGNLWGKLVFEEKAAKAISAWQRLGGQPRPEHPKLLHYNGRRTAHLLKLCIVASTSKRNDLIITHDDFSEALDWMLESEIYMPDIFKSMAIGGDAKAIEDCWYYCYSLWVKTQGKENIPEDRIIEFLQNRVPAHSVERVLQVMVKSKLLEKMIDGYRPRAKKAI